MSYAIYVGNHLTAEGCVYLAGYGDEPSSHWLEIAPARTYPADATVTVGVTAEANFPGELIAIPQVPATNRYISVNYSYYRGFPAPLTNGGLNEHHVAVRDVWSPSRPELQAMTPSCQRGVNYSDLARIVLQRARSAREGVAIIGDLIARHGYATYGGNSHLIADHEEGWVVIEFAGGQGLWVAERLGPDDIRISRPGYIGVIPPNFHEHPDFRGAPHLIDFAIEQGWYEPAQGEPFNVNSVYGDGKLQWPGAGWIEQELQTRAQRAEKITLRDMMDAVRTPKLTGDTAGYGQIVPLRADSHPALGLLWHAPSAAVTAPFIPCYLGVMAMPAEYGQHRYLTAGEASRFIQSAAESPRQQSQVTPAIEATRSAFQLGKRLFYLTLQQHATFLPEVSVALAAFEAQLIAQQSIVEQTALTLYEADKADLAGHYLTYICHTEALKAVDLMETLVESLDLRTRYRVAGNEEAPATLPNVLW